MTRRVALSTARQSTGDRQTDELWERINTIIRFLHGSPLADSILLTEEQGARKESGLEFSAGVARSIPHGLGRRARGFVEVYGADVPSAAQVGLRATAHPTNTTSDTHITVTPTNTGTCWIAVF